MIFTKRNLNDLLMFVVHKMFKHGPRERGRADRVCPDLQTAGFLPSRNFQVRGDMHCAGQPLKALNPERFERVKEEKEQYRWKKIKFLLGQAVSPLRVYCVHFSLEESTLGVKMFAQPGTLFVCPAWNPFSSRVWLMERQNHTQSLSKPVRTRKLDPSKHRRQEHRPFPFPNLDG